MLVYIVVFEAADLLGWNIFMDIEITKTYTIPCKTKQVVILRCNFSSISVLGAGFFFVPKGNAGIVSLFFIESLYD